MAALERVRGIALDSSVTPRDAGRLGLHGQSGRGAPIGLSSCSAYPDIDLEAVRAAFPALAAEDPAALRQLERDARYAPYLERQAQDVARLRRDEAVAIPGLARLSGDRRGSRTSCGTSSRRHRPETVAQAARIEGMTPAALTLVLLRVRQGEAARVAS